MEIVKLTPATKNYIWGGDTFSSWGKVKKGEKVAECWELSFHKDGLTTIASGENTGKALADVATKQDLGINCERFQFFPILVKLIDAHNNLSVQVHPSDEYALKNENSFGKTEMWYVLDAKKDCGLYIGFNQKMNTDSVKKAIDDQTIMDKLNFYPCKSGDCFFIPSGTIHAIGQGVTVVEVQQNSNLTYRVYDYNRKDAQGNTRPLHIDKALKVLSFDKYTKTQKQILSDRVLLAKCKYFTAYEADAEKLTTLKNDNSFMSITFVSGNGVVNDLPYTRGDSFFIPAGKEAKIQGDGIYILSQVD